MYLYDTVLKLNSKKLLEQISNLMKIKKKNTILGLFEFHL
jgi:hypothetical protein